MSALWVAVVATRGSAPRDAGTAMKVTAETSEGTIGGGALEYQAIAKARDLIARGGAEVERTIPLGPDLGQCCGGAVTLRFTRAPQVLDPAPQTGFGDVPAVGARLPLWLWGAGHVGRAVVAAVPLQVFDVTWVDSGSERFPAAVRPGVTALPATDMPMLAARAPEAANHLIFTYSHEIDLALCTALLKRGAASIGLIGSDTKRARFFKRLRAMGLDPAPILCPIGDKALGKAPEAIARGTITALLSAVPAEAVS